MAAHARLSASSSDRWMNCPGSVALSELLPEPETTEFAREGSFAHAIAERLLRSGDDAWTAVGSSHPEFADLEVSPEMADHLQLYLDTVRSIPGSLRVETRIEVPEIGPDFGGTADAIVTGDGFLHVIDLKYGAGVAVDAAGNSQLLYYAYGAMRAIGVQPSADLVVRMTIVQPRTPAGSPVQTVEVPSQTVYDWGEGILLPAMAEVNAAGRLETGEHCRFCPARLVCPKLQETFEERASAASPLDALTPEALAAAYEKIAPVEAYIRALKDECFRRAQRGEPVPGTKLVAGRADRQWKEGAAEAMVAAFGEEAFNPPELRSPAQLEKLPGGKDFAGEWAYKQPGKPTLVSSDDKRPALAPEANVFANVGETV